jgi:hypothetical protein
MKFEKLLTVSRLSFENPPTGWLGCSSWASRVAGARSTPINLLRNTSSEGKIRQSQVSGLLIAGSSDNQTLILGGQTPRKRLERFRGHRDVAGR